jgi:hypothetical protein
MTTKRLGKKNAEFVVGATILAGLAVSALYVILSGKYGTDTQKWAYGVLGSALTAALRFLK